MIKARRKIGFHSLLKSRFWLIFFFVALLFGALMGLLWLATVPLTNGIILTFLGPKYLGTFAGFAFLSHQAGAVIGAWAGGKIFDIYGNYDNAWWISVILGITAFLLHILIQEKAFTNKLAHEN